GLPRELREEWQRIVVARGSLPGQARHLGRARFAALEQQLAVAAVSDRPKRECAARLGPSLGPVRMEWQGELPRMSAGDRTLVCGSLVALHGSPHHIMGTIGALTGTKPTTRLGETEDA